MTQTEFDNEMARLHREYVSAIENGDPMALDKYQKAVDDLTARYFKEQAQKGQDDKPK